MSKKDEAVTAPLQCALSTKAGCECIAHILQTVTDVDKRATIASIDGIRAFDLISTGPPFARCFCVSPSKYLWEDEMGVSQDIPQGREGDRLMPMSFVLGQHKVLLASRNVSRKERKVFAFLDDIHVVCAPERVGDVCAIIVEELFATQGSRDGRHVLALSRRGVGSSQAEERKDVPLSKSVEKGKARLVILAAEVGGRWLAETARFLVVQSQGEDSARAPPKPRDGSMVATVERHVGFKCSQGCRPLLVRLLGSGVLPQHPL